MYPRSPEVSQDPVNKKRERGWGGGKGRDTARELLLRGQGDVSGRNASEASGPFHIGDDED